MLGKLWEREGTHEPLSYKPEEKTLLDCWEILGGRAYSGKVCDRGTEILTTGIQRLHLDPLRFAEQDPEYFSMVVSTLRKW